MVKFNSLLKFISICSLLTFVTGENTECDTLDKYFRNNEDISFRCFENDNGEIDLYLEGGTLNQADINEIAKYPNLSELSLIRIEELPENLSFKSLNLDTIFFNNLKYGRKINKFSKKYIPNGILKTLKHVKTIYISSNKISQNTINELGSLTNVELISLINSGFDENLDYSPLKNAKKLTQLTLDTYGGENPVGGLPESLCEIKSLKQLDVSGNSITTIPKCISNLNKLQILNLSYNELTTLPKEFGKLTNLVELNLGDNLFTSIPSSLKKLKNLEKLNLDFNKIEKASLSGLSKLEELVLTDNEISSISLKDLSNLKYLNLVDNHLTSIPSSLAKLKNLERLLLRYNEIDGSIPQSLNNLKNLKEIDLSRNKNIKGKTLTNPKLTICKYTEYNEITDKICLDKNSVCIPEESIPKC